MSEENIGVSDLGTGEQEQTQAVETSVETPQAEEVKAESSEKEAGILRELQQTKDELRREREYNEFVKQSAQYREPEKQAEAEFDLKPDDIPYVADVDKLIEIKAGRLVEAKLQAMEQERVKSDLLTMAEEHRKSDTNFDTRMEYAVELLQNDPLCAREFDRARTAKDKITVLEKIAKWHPKFSESLLTKEPEKKNSSDEALQKIKENAGKPPTLSSVGGQGSSIKAWSQMSDDEYIKAFKEVTKGY
jgi:hypothetical protein